MVTFGFEARGETNKLFNYLNQINENLKEEHLIRNPFHGQIIMLGNRIIFYIKPIYPNLPLIMIFILGIITYFAGHFVTWINITIIILIFLSSLWTKYFYYLVLKLYIIIKSNKCKINLVSNDIMVGWLISDRMK